MKTIKTWLTIAVLMYGISHSYAATQTFDDWSSPSISHNSSSSNTYTFTTVGNTVLSFNWSVSCEEYFDLMIVNLDGANILTKSGKNNGTFTQELPEGEHTLIVTYIKDEAGSDGDDGCKISKVKVAPNTTISSGYSIFDDWRSTNYSDGSTSHRTYTFNNTVNALLSFDWMVSSESGCDKLIILLDGVTILTQSGEKSGTHAASLAPGEHTLTVKYTKDSSDDEGQDCAKISSVKVEIVETSGVLSFPSWKSTNKSNSSTSSKLYTFNTNGNAILSYDWLVSSESADKLTVTLDNKIVLTKSGEYSGSINHSLGSGAHTLLVKYAKDSSDGEGGDFGEISNIVVEDVIASGTCGDNLNWRLYHTGLLKISGTGEMANYSTSSSQTAPWNGYKNSIVSVKIDEGVTTVGSYAFYDHTALTDIEFPKGIVSIGAGAFAGCTAFSSFTIPDGITTISSEMLTSCSNLTTVVVPESVITIGSSAFSYCSKLENINLPNSITSIQNNAFRGCSKIKSITIPQSVKTFGTYVFYGCTGDLTINCNIPSKSSSSSGVFYGGNFSKITVGEGVTQIGNNAFYKCESVDTISIAETVTSIGSSAFEHCESLESINIPEGITKINNYTFYYCTALKSVSIPNSVTSIGSRAFYNCKSLESINIPNSVTSIGDWAFSSCDALESVFIPKGVTSIGSSAFGSCDKLSSIVVSEENEYYDSRNNCNAIIETNSNTLIATCLGTIIPNTVTTIGEDAFSFSKLKEINIPNSVTTIGDQAFSYSNITEINIPSSVTTIGNEAFYWCSSKKIVIPESVESIGDNAFKYCSNLDVYFHKNVDLSNFGLDSKTKIHLIINDESNKDLDTSIGNIYTSITYNRNLTPGKYETIILPFAPNAESLENFAFYELSSVNGDVLNFSEVSAPQTNTPYLYTLRPGKYTTEITGGETTISSEINTPKVAVWKTTGSFANQTVDCSKGDGYYYEFNTQNNKLQNNVTNIILKPYHVYFKSAMANVATLNIHIDGKAINDMYTITYIVDGEVYHVEAVEPSAEIPAVAPPVKEGYTFNGWEKMPSNMPGENITIYAKFTPNNYTVTFNANGEVISSESLAYGTAIIAPTAPEIDDYSFVEWTNLLATVPAHDVEFVAVYKQVNVKIVDDISSFSQGEDVLFEKITYTRTLSKVNTWYALYVPFEIPVTAEFLEDYEVAYFNDIRSYDEYVGEKEDGVKGADGVIERLDMEVLMVREGATLNANYPYLIRAKNEDALNMNIRVENAMLYKAEETTVGCSSVFMKFDVTGIYTTQTAGDLKGEFNVYAISDGCWEQVTDDAQQLSPFRLYLSLSAINGSPVKVSAGAMKSIRIRVDGEEGGMQTENHTITYQVDGETYHSENLSSGAEIPGINEPEKKGYVFGGWNGLPQTMPNGDVVVTGSFIRLGDLNRDGKILVNDVVMLVNVLLGGGADNLAFRVGDVNADGHVLVNDVVMLVNTLLNPNSANVRTAPRGSRTGVAETLSGESREGGFILSVSNAVDYTAIQFDMLVPEGVDISRIEKRIGAGHTVMSGKIGENTVRVVLASMSNRNFRGNELLEVVAESAAEAEIQITNVCMSTREGLVNRPEGISVRIPGNTTGIGTLPEGNTTFDVYDTNGRLVKKGASPTDRLPSGVYVINGKKVVVK